MRAGFKSLAAYMAEDLYRDFALATAKQVAYEESLKMRDEMSEDLTALTREWAMRLGERITKRMDALGIPQELQIAVDWAPGAPAFEVTGNTYVGGPEDDEDS